MIRNKYLDLKKYKEFIIRSLKSGRVSYSQTGEDLILDLFLHEKENGFYVDVGANHPKRLNNTYFFYKKGWRGINIEPNPLIFSRFSSSRPKDINLNIGIDKCLKTSTFFLFKEDALSTFSKEIAEKYEKMGHEIKEERQISLKPLSLVLRENNFDNNLIDFFSIDTEGNDLSVLESNDWIKFRPKFIILETLEYKKNGFGSKLDYDNYFKHLSYKRIIDTYINSIYINLDFLDEFRISSNIISI